MTNEIDTKLTEFTEQLMSGADPKELSWAPEGGELHEYQKLVVSLSKFSAQTTLRISEDRILSRLKENWDSPKARKTQVWKSSRKRKTTFAYSLAFAVLVAAVIIFPILPSGESDLPGAAQGGNLIPLVIILIGLSTIAYLIFGRSGNGKH